jgi:hypothetical protein
LGLGLGLGFRIRVRVRAVARVRVGLLLLHQHALQMRLAAGRIAVAVCTPEARQGVVGIAQVLDAAGQKGVHVVPRLGRRQQRLEHVHVLRLEYVEEDLLVWQQCHGPPRHREVAQQPAFRSFHRSFHRSRSFLRRRAL